MLFRNRVDAGRKLAVALQGLRGSDCVVLALPRGGVPVAVEVARALDAPVDLLLVRKIGAPSNPEVAIGSVVDGGAPIIVQGRELLRLTGTSQRIFEDLCVEELAEVERRRRRYLGGRTPIPLEGRTAIVIDDGLATGNTMRAALQAARLRHPAKLLLAVPVAPVAALKDFREMVDAVVCLATPEPFGSVGEFYEDFTQLTDAEVIGLLKQHESVPSIAAGRS